MSLPRSKRACFFCGGFFDAQLGQALFNGFGHAPQSINFFHECPGFIHQGRGAPFYLVAAPKGIDKAGYAAFLLQVQLGFTGDSGRIIRRQGDGFIQGIGVQGLGAP